MWTHITARHICITKIPSSLIIQWAHHLGIACFQRVCRNKYESRHVHLCSDIFIKLTNIIGQQINYVNKSNSLAWTFPQSDWFPVHFPALSLTSANISVFDRCLLYWIVIIALRIKNEYTRILFVVIEKDEKWLGVNHLMVNM